jgi:hypothetical protein
MTSSFGIRDKNPAGYEFNFQYGTDLDADAGEDVHASYNGICTGTFPNTSGGMLMAMAYSDGSPPYLNMRYLHLSEFIANNGDTVTAGSVIAKSGATGTNRAHLHMETYLANTSVFSNNAIRSNPVRHFPGIPNRDPTITSGPHGWWEPGDLDLMNVSIEIPGDELDLSVLGIKVWDPTADNAASWVIYYLEEMRVEIFDNHNGELTNQTDFTDLDTLYGIWCSGDIVCSEIIVTPMDFSAGGTFTIDLYLNPLQAATSYLSLWGVQVVDVHGNVTEWGSYSSSPVALVERLVALRDGKTVSLELEFLDCTSFEEAHLTRTAHGSESEELITIFRAEDMPTGCRYTFHDEGADYTKSYEYLLRLYDQSGSSLASAKCQYIGVPSAHELRSVYPNPFNARANIEFVVSGDSPVRVQLEIYNIRGQLVRTVHTGMTAPGRYTKRWDGKDEFGSDVASGVYFNKFVAGSDTKTTKMVLLK